MILSRTNQSSSIDRWNMFCIFCFFILYFPPFCPFFMKTKDYSSNNNYRGQKLKSHCLDFFEQSTFLIRNFFVMNNNCQLYLAFVKNNIKTLILALKQMLQWIFTKESYFSIIPWITWNTKFFAVSMRTSSQYK